MSPSKATGKNRPENKIGIGLIGAGSRGLLNLANKICHAQEKLGLQMVALCDSHPQRLEEGKVYLEQCLKEAGQRQTLSTYLSEQDLVNDPKVDLVMITTPQDAHQGPFIAAAQAGKAIYCDKPLAASRQDCLNMQKAYSDYGRPCILGFTRRYENAWIQMHRMIEDGAIGTPRMLLLRSVIPYDTYFHRWHRKRSASGGILNEKSAHHFDALNWFAGSAPKSLYALGGRSGAFAPRPGYPARCSECDKDCPWRRSEQSESQDAQATFQGSYDNDPDSRMINDQCVYDPNSDIDDHDVVTIQYENGIQAVLFLSIFGPQSHDQETLEVVGDAGRMILTRHDGTIDIVKVGPNAKHQKIDARSGDHNTSHFGADNHLVQTIAHFAREGGQPPVGFDEALRASMMAFAAQESVDGGGQVMELSK